MSLQDGNTSPETADDVALTQDAATERLFGSMQDSEAAPSDQDSEPDAEAEDLEAEADEVEAETPDDADDEDAEYEDADDTDLYADADDQDDDGEEPLFEINGQQVTLDEIGKGYLRQSDYTKKTQELAQTKKEMDQLQVSIAAERQHLQEMLALANNTPADEPDWVQLANDDPLEYTRQRAIFEATKAERDAKDAEAARLADIQRGEEAQRLQTFVEEQAEKMVEAIPELGGEKAPEYKANVARYMEGIGYTKEELSKLFDARAVILADKARKYDELMSKKTTAKKKVKRKPKVLRPGVTKGKQAVKADQQRKRVGRLRKTGSVDDAVALLMGE